MIFKKKYKDFSRLCEPYNPAAVEPPLYILRPKYVHFNTNMQSTQSYYHWLVRALRQNSYFTGAGK